jgi:hypothetical protein
VRIRGREVPVTSAELTGDERADAWALMCRTWPNYSSYEEHTDRVIPVIRLTPMTG